MALLYAVVGVKAQAWTSGATVDAGEYYLYNIGADGYLNTGSSWNTHSVVDGQGLVTTLANVSENVYTIYTGVKSKYLQTVWMDQDAYNWTFEAVSVSGYTNAYTIKNDAVGYFYWAGGGSGSFSNECLNSTTITEGSESNFYWLLIPKTTRQNTSSASVSSPLDVTYLMTNPGFEYQVANDNKNSAATGSAQKTATGWTTGGFWRQNSSQTFANANFFEKWSSSGLTTEDKIYQSVTLAAGTYRLEATANASCTQAYIYAADDEIQVSASGKYSLQFTVETEGSIELGAKIKAGGSGQWFAVDNFRLYYLGTSSALKTELNSSINSFDSANEYLGSYNTTALASWNAVKTASQAVYDNGSATNNQIIAAIEAMNEANDKIEAIVAAYRSNTPADFTYAIQNSSFETGDLTGWSVTESQDTGVKENSNNTYKTTGVDGNYLFNTWWKGNPITQAISNLPNGLYQLKALVANDATGAGNRDCIYLTGNGTHSAPVAGAGAGAFVEGSLYFTVSDGTATIGAVGGEADALGTYTSEGYYWYKADKFQLQYLGSSTTVDQAVEIPSGVMNADIQSALTTANTNYSSDKSVANYNALLYAVAQANYSIINYANAKTALDDVKPVLDATNVYTSAAYATNYTDVKTAYDNRTLTDNAAKAYSYGSRYAGAVPSVLLSPWTIGGTAATTDGSGLYINTWSTEGNTDGSGMTTPFFEYWVADANQVAATSIVGTLSGLDANRKYKITALVRVRQQDDQTKADNGITFQVGSGDAVSAVDGTLCNSVFYYKTIQAVGSTDGSGNLTMTFTVNADSHISWLAFKNVNYETYGATDSEKADLAAAIDAVDDYVAGYQDGEYAPHTNAEAFALLAAAQDIVPDDPLTASSEVVTAATEALNNATWTINDGEVNALANADFEGSYTVKAGTGVTSDRAIYEPAGWTVNYTGDKNDMTVLNPSSDLAATNFTSTPSALGNGGNNTYRYRGLWGTNTDIKVYQSITLPAGTYLLTCDAWKSGLGGDGSIFAGEETATLSGNATSWRTLSLQFTLADETTLNVGFRLQHTAVNSDAKFLAFDNFELYSVNTISENDATATVTGKKHSVTLTRTLKGGQWNGFSVPFGFTVAGSALDGASVKQFASVSENEITLEDATEIVAGEPYLVKPASDVVNPVFEDVDVTAATDVVKGEGDYKFASHLYNTSLATDGSVAYVSTTDSSIKKLTSGSIKGLRSIFNIPTGEGGEVKALVIRFDGSTDGIITVDAEGNMIEGAIYNLAGQRIAAPQKGVNIINGKKVLVK